MPSIYNPRLSEILASGSYPEGSTQLPFVLTWALEGATFGLTRCGCCDYILLNDNISYFITFSIIDCSNSSLILCVFFKILFQLIQLSFHFTCRLIRDGGSTIASLLPNWVASSNRFFHFFSINFSSRKS